MGQFRTQRNAHFLIFSMAAGARRRPATEMMYRARRFIGQEPNGRHTEMMLPYALLASFWAQVDTSRLGRHASIIGLSAISRLFSIAITSPEGYENILATLIGQHEARTRLPPLPFAACARPASCARPRLPIERRRVAPLDVT